MLKSSASSGSRKVYHCVRNQCRRPAARRCIKIVAHLALVIAFRRRHASLQGTNWLYCVNDTDGRHTLLLISAGVAREVLGGNWC